MRLADAHMHLFRHGFRRAGAASLFGAGEVAAYEALREAHDVDLALAIGYEADGVDPGNNGYLRELARSRDWLKTLAYVGAASAPDLGRLETLLDQGHCGLAIYAPDAAAADAVARWPRDCWQALQSRRAIVSFNAKPEALKGLKSVVAAWPEATFLFSHLGLPGRLAPAATKETLRARIERLLSLAPLENACVKISGVYATSARPHAFPHEQARIVIDAVLAAFGLRRCLWASDFAPALEFLSFQQTIEWPGWDSLSPSEASLVFHDNLERLLFAP